MLLICKTPGFPGVSEGKASAYNAGDQGSIPGLGRSPGEGNGTPLQYSCLENPKTEKPGTTVHRVSKSRTWLSDFTSLQYSKYARIITVLWCSTMMFINHQVVVDDLLCFRCYERRPTWLELNCQWGSVCRLSHFSYVRFFASPWTADCQVPLSMGFSRQECQSGLPHPPPGDLLNPGTEIRCLLPVSCTGFFTTSTSWEGLVNDKIMQNCWKDGKKVLIDVHSQIGIMVQFYIKCLTNTWHIDSKLSIR